MRLSANLIVIAEPGNEIPGIALGLESPMSKHFSLSFDGTMGVDAQTSMAAFNAGVHYYFRETNKGLFIGPSVSSVKLKGKGEGAVFNRRMYEMGLNLGVKSPLSERIHFHLTLQPQISVENFSSTAKSVNLQTGMSYEFN
jgi:hypothetical protein